MFWWKKIAIEERLDCYFEECDRCFQMFEKAIATLLEAGNGPAFESAVDRAHESESGADDLRREIELTLYGRALLPESRDDLLDLLENFDALLRNPRFTLHAVKEVDAKESASDRLEREMLKWIYSSDLEGYRRLELKELVKQIGRISDLAEHTADLIGIIALKRQI